MSIEYLNLALKTQGLTPTKKLILVILGNYADEKGSCYPSYKHIAKIIGLKDTKGIQKTIKEFEELGYLQIEHRKTENGGYTSNRYHIKLGMGVETPRGEDTSRVGVSEPSNTKDDTKTNIVNESFNLFWKIYPRRIGRKTALKSFTKFDTKHFEKILYATKLFARDNSETDEKFIPHPTTWLNQERWLDYFELDEVGTVIRPKQKFKTKNNLAG